MLNTGALTEGIRHYNWVQMHEAAHGRAHWELKPVIAIQKPKFYERHFSSFIDFAFNTRPVDTPVFKFPPAGIGHPRKGNTSRNYVPTALFYPVGARGLY